MDRLNQLRGEAGPSRDCTLDTTSPPSEAFMSANESSSKYYSLSDVDSTFDISPIKDVSLGTAATEADRTVSDSEDMIRNLSPIGKKGDILDYKIGKQIEAANILSGGVDIFDDNDSDELIIDDNVESEDKSDIDTKAERVLAFPKEDNNLVEETVVPSKDTEVVLQIDGKNVDAIDIGNGLYLYRKGGGEELAAVQIIDDDQPQPSFKFLKVRENAESNLEVYEEIEIEVPKEVPVKEKKTAEKNVSHVPIKDINKVMSDPTSNKVAERLIKPPVKEIPASTSDPEKEIAKESSSESKEVNLNGKMMKFSESRKSPVFGTFTPMKYHSTPNKEGVPLTKTMVNKQLHPNRHSDNIKKTIEVHTDSVKPKSSDTLNKNSASDDEKLLNTDDHAEKSMMNPDLDQNTEITTQGVPELSGEEVQKQEISTEALINLDKSMELVEGNLEREEEKGINIPSLKSDDKDLVISEVSETQYISEKCGSGVIYVEKNEEKYNLVGTAKSEQGCISEKISIISDKNDNNDIVSSSVSDVIEEKDNNEPPQENITKELKNKEPNKGEDTIQNKQHPVMEADIIIENKADMNIKKPEVEVTSTVTIGKVEQDSALDILQKQEKLKTNQPDNPSQSLEISYMEEEGKSLIQNKSTKDEKDKKIDIAIKPTQINLPLGDTKLEKEYIKNIDKVKPNKTTLPVITNIQQKDNSSLEKNMQQKGSHSLVTNKEENHTPQTITNIEQEFTTPLTSNVEQKITSLLMTSTEELKITTAPTPPIEQKIITPMVTNILGKITPTSKSNIQTNIIKVEQKNIPPVMKNIQQTSTQPPKINVENKLTMQDVKQSVSTEPLHSFGDIKSDVKQFRIGTKVDDSIVRPSINQDKSINPDVKSTKIMGNNNKTENKEVKESQRELGDTKLYVTENNVAAGTILKDDKILKKDLEVEQTEKIIEGTNTKSNILPKAETHLKRKVESPNPIAKDNKVNDPKTTVLPNTQKDYLGKKEPHSETSVSVEQKLPFIPETKKQIETVTSKSVVEIPKSNTSSDINAKGELIKKENVLSHSGIPIASTGHMPNVPITLIEQKPVQSAQIKVDDKSSKGLTQETKTVNNNQAAVPFGKWTEANRQEFLNKIKESKVPSNPSNTQQLKQPNDLNRRDVLKKIDSQRTASNAAKNQEITKNKLNARNKIPSFSNKPIVNQIGFAQTAVLPVPSKPADTPIEVKKVEKVVPIEVPKTESIEAANLVKKEPPNKRTEINNQDLIDKTIEDMINRAPPVKPTSSESTPTVAKETLPKPKAQPTLSKAAKKGDHISEIERQMNELHGIPLVERPVHELPQIVSLTNQTFLKSENPKIPDKNVKVPPLVPFSNKNLQKQAKENVDVESDEELIEHVPITGDIAFNKKNDEHTSNKLSSKGNATITTESAPVNATTAPTPVNANAPKKESIITEKDFDKFARRNSKTYENCLTVNFDLKEQHNVVQTVIEKDKNIGPNVIAATKTKLPRKSQSQSTHTLVQSGSKIGPSKEEVSNKNYQSKLQMAYQSALTAKRHKEIPIKILEDKPVKVVVMDSNTELSGLKLNVQGQSLSPAKKQPADQDSLATGDSFDSDILDAMSEKHQDEVKTKSKHQRKQVLTPVDNPDLELIEPSDLGIEVSPKKKRRIDDKCEKISKNIVPKKTYLLGRSVASADSTPKYQEPKNPDINPIHTDIRIEHSDTGVSALDSLVKAAELIENQAENRYKTEIDNQDSPQSTPAKRGRGRPRKYPVPEDKTPVKEKALSPQKKPRLIDARKSKPVTDSDTDDSSDEGMVQENWTMGKINENIVCPICSKLFRSENVVFKHVKHCTGPSPNRSDSDKRSSRRSRQSQDSRTSTTDSTDESEKYVPRKYTPKKRTSKEEKPTVEEVIVIEDTPIKEKPAKKVEKPEDTKKVNKPTMVYKSNNLVCEFCGKSFRQLSYLVSHKLQHKNETASKPETVTQNTNKNIFSCEVCKKEFRKLHHLVQHRIIHNPSGGNTRLSRKSSYELAEGKSSRNASKNDDQSAGFRCEPCDKSFRKLHHLVEHRETHDGINRQKIVSPQPAVEKPTPPPQCEICKKTFRKLHHLIEHKEQHLETNSEKSDDKSVKSSLSTKDIIHECSLCYMVFPNEHSLTKHTVICQRKKRQSASKQPKQEEDEEGNETKDNKVDTVDEIKAEGGDNMIKLENISSVDTKETNISVPPEKHLGPKISNEPKKIPTSEVRKSIEQTKKVEITRPTKPETSTLENVEKIKSLNITTEVDATKVKKSDIKEIKATVTPKQKAKEKASPLPKRQKETPSIADSKRTAEDAPKQRAAKERVAPTVTKRQKEPTLPPPVAEEKKPAVDSSDDDEVRYMLNPDFKIVEESEGKLFMKVRANKRNSLQIERPNSKDLVKRRISLQHPPKIPKLKSKIEKALQPVSEKAVPKEESAAGTDSDDSDVKYSFPVQKSQEESRGKRSEKKPARKSTTERRKSLSGIAKRKSIGKGLAKNSAKVSPTKALTRRAELRCDCGQQFGSAALLARHALLAHTPPRRARGPPAARPGAVTAARPGASTSRQPKRGAHAGVPVPDKMRRMMEKNAK